MLPPKQAGPRLRAGTWRVRQVPERTLSSGHTVDWVIEWVPADGSHSEPLTPHARTDRDGREDLRVSVHRRWLTASRLVAEALRLPGYELLAATNDAGAFTHHVDHRDNKSLDCRIQNFAVLPAAINEAAQHHAKLVKRAKRTKS